MEVEHYTEAVTDFSYIDMWADKKFQRVLNFKTLTSLLKEWRLLIKFNKDSDVSDNSHTRMITVLEVKEFH